MDIDRALARLLAAQLPTVEAPHFVAEPLDPLAIVVRFTELSGGTQLVGKFYARKWAPERSGAEAEAMRTLLLHQEASGLRALRAAGFDGPPYEVVRPLACAPELEALLLTAHAPGLSLTELLRASLLGQSNGMPQAVTRVADFLARLHSRTRTCQPADPAAPLLYLAKIVGQLAAASLLDQQGAAALRAMGDRWMARGWLHGDTGLIHGDATPANMLLAPALLTMIDGERIRTASSETVRALG